MNEPKPLSPISHLLLALALAFAPALGGCGDAALPNDITLPDDDDDTVGGDDDDDSADDDDDDDDDDDIVPDVCDGPANLYSGNYLVALASDAVALCDTWTGVDGDLTVTSPTLVDLAGLACLCEVTGFLKVEGNQLLVDASGLDNLETVGGELKFKTNSLLTVAPEMPSLTDTGGSLKFEENPLLVTSTRTSPR